MLNKVKFKPQITRVKLDIEQAVLTCNCYDTGMIDGMNFRTATMISVTQFCLAGVKTRQTGTTWTYFHNNAGATS